MKINFFAGEKIFSCGRKFTGIREKILRHTGRNNIHHLSSLQANSFSQNTDSNPQKERPREASPQSTSSLLLGRVGVSFTCEPTRGPP